MGEGSGPRRRSPHRRSPEHLVERVEALLRIHPGWHGRPAALLEALTPEWAHGPAELIAAIEEVRPELERRGILIGLEPGGKGYVSFHRPLGDEDDEPADPTNDFTPGDRGVIVREVLTKAGMGALPGLAPGELPEDRERA